MPVETISQKEAMLFCSKLSQKENMEYRLPTEAEWEYSCRAGSISPFSTGNTISTEQANYNGRFIYPGGKEGIYREKTVPVGSFPPNAWGLYDMHGNVFEWCLDQYGPYPVISLPSIVPPNKEEIKCILRGGSWINTPDVCRSARRHSYNPDLRGFLFGLRVVLVNTEDNKKD